jgi:hypothetical protein
MSNKIQNPNDKRVHPFYSAFGLDIWHSFGICLPCEMLAQLNSASRTPFGGFNRAGLFHRGALAFGITALSRWAVNIFPERALYRRRTL